MSHRRTSLAATGALLCLALTSSAGATAVPVPYPDHAAAPAPAPAGQEHPCFMVRPRWTDHQPVC